LISACLENSRDQSQGSVLSQVAAVKSAHFPASEKRDFLEHLWQSSNPEKILLIGRSVRDVEYDPIWKLALQSPSPERLLEGWRRFEKYAHSSNRVKIDPISETQIKFQRYSTSDTPPNIKENHLICGLLIALLCEIGCQNVSCYTVNKSGDLHKIFGAKEFHKIVNTSEFSLIEWVIDWNIFIPQSKKQTEQIEIPVFPTASSDNGIGKQTVYKAARTVISDISRLWKIGDLADELGMSSRSFQRRLSEAGLNFSTLVRSLRIHMACMLLKDTNSMITTVGFCTGFSDSAHFSRNFRASMGMTPSEFKLQCNRTELATKTK